MSKIQIGRKDPNRYAQELVQHVHFVTECTVE